MRRITPFLLLAGMAAVRLCAASGVSYTGNFTSDADEHDFFFTLSAAGSVTLRTLSYAGGVNSAGTTIPSGGFDPTISVFDSSGKLIAYNADGGCGSAVAGVAAFCWDSFLQLSLPAGNYTAVLTQSENLPNGPTLADSFAYDPALCVPALVCATDAQGNFTAAPGGAAPGFWDLSLSKRTSFYALDIVGASAAVTTSITSSAVLPSGFVGEPYRFTFTAASGSGVMLRWSVAAGSTLPANLTLDPATGVLSGAPAFTGDFPFTIQVTDGIQTVTQNVTLFVSQVVSNQVTIETTSLPAGLVGQSYSAVLAAVGGTGNIVWTSSPLPAGLKLSSSGNITGTPTAPSSTMVTFSAQDSATGQAASATLTLTVSVASLVITGNANPGDFALGATVAGSYRASGGAPPYKWTLSGAPGLTVDSSGNVRGSASQPGNFNATLTVTDSANATSTFSLNFTVLGVTGSFPAGTTTSSYSGSASGVGGVPPYSYSASGIPQGLSFSGNTLSGQPASPGTYTVGVQVTDSKGVSVSGNFSFTITGPGPAALTIITTSLPNGYEDKPYSESVEASGGAPGYTWSQTGGKMPPGLSLNGSGTIMGTATAAGSYVIGVRVSDTSGGQAIGTVAIDVEPAPLRITTGAIFPSGQVGIDYPVQILTAAGGTQPYTFSIQGSLPAGLTLANDEIGGTPTTPGDFAFTVIATDSAATPLKAALNVTGTINPNSPDLLLSSATAFFSLAPGSSGGSTPNTITVSSTVVSQPLSFATSSDAPWVTVSGSPGTPGSIAIDLNSTALALTPDGSPYLGTVTVKCTSPACSGSQQTIAVTLSVTALGPQLSLGSPILSFVESTSNPQPSSTALAIVNAGGGSLEIQSVTASDSWISVGDFPSTVLPGPGGSVTVTTNAAGLKPGYYLGSVTVNSAAGSETVPVTLLYSGSAVMTLGPAGTQFSMTQGGALGNASGSFLVGVSSGSVSYNVSVLPGAPWLSGSGSGNATPDNPGTVSFSIDQTAAAALATGAYYGTIRVSASGVFSSPQDFQVVLDISPGGTRIIPDPEPAGLLFIGSAAALPAQTIRLYASSKIPIAYQAAAAVTDGSGWLSISSVTGSTSAASPANISVTASPAGLAPGVYRGAVSFTFAAAVRTVNVTLIVQVPFAAASKPAQAITSSGSPGGRGSTLDAPACAAAQLVPTQTGLVSNFATPASWPTPLAIKLVDTCGNPVGNAQIVTTFTNGDPPMVLSAIDTANGLYSGTWTPRKTSSQVTILARASAPGYASAATVQIAGQVAPNTAPELVPNGTLDIFHPQTGAGLGPGNIVQIYGKGLATQPVAPMSLPLPTEVNGTLVVIGGVQAPLYYVSPGQINAQIPFELTPGTQYQVIVSANGALTAPQPIQLTDAVPAVLQFTSGAVVAQHLDGTLVSDSLAGHSRRISGDLSDRTWCHGHSGAQRHGLAVGSAGERAGQAGSDYQWSRGPDLFRGTDAYAGGSVPDQFSDSPGVRQRRL